MSYKLKLDFFEGPLDLLLYLVKKDHVNIYDIPISEITEQYIGYLELMKSLDLNIAGEFMVMAATLMQIKSKMLLPPDENPKEEEDEDPRADLIRQLLEYEKYKEIAETLRRKETDQREMYKRPKIADSEIPVDENPGYFEASIFDLIDAFSRALKEAPKDLFYKVIKDEFTVEDKIHDILHLLLLESRVQLGVLFSKTRHKVEIVVTFLAILELIRLKEISVWQKGLFGDIDITRNENNIVPYHGRVQIQEGEKEQLPG
ncbi:MAG: segregation/condensation protein A [Candidatus Omnitrophica bacterium]|nr:segregation/condensation protein A [Candidatus Omnitrophota bacterium]